MTTVDTITGARIDSSGTEAADALTADGGIVTIRPIQASDRPRLGTLYRDASPESLRLRFFGRPSSGTLTAELDRLCGPESDRHLAVLAVEADRVVGVASCERTDAADHRAEFSVFVADDHRAAVSRLCCSNTSGRGHTPAA